MENKVRAFKNANMLNYYTRVYNLKFYLDSLDKFKNNLIKHTEIEIILENYDAFKWILSFLVTYLHDNIGYCVSEEVIIDFNNILSFIDLSSEEYEIITSTNRLLTKEESIYLYNKLDNDYSEIYNATNEKQFIDTLSIDENILIFDEIITLVYSDKIEKIVNNIYEDNNMMSRDEYITDGDGNLYIKNNYETYSAEQKCKINSHMSVDNFNNQISKLNYIFNMKNPCDNLLNKIYDSIVFNVFKNVEDNKLLSIEHTILKLTYLDAYQHGEDTITWHNYTNAFQKLRMNNAKKRTLIKN